MRYSSSQPTDPLCLVETRTTSSVLPSSGSVSQSRSALLLHLASLPRHSACSSPLTILTSCGSSANESRTSTLRIIPSLVATLKRPTLTLGKARIHILRAGHTRASRRSTRSEAGQICQPGRVSLGTAGSTFPSRRVVLRCGEYRATSASDSACETASRCRTGRLELGGERACIYCRLRLGGHCVSRRVGFLHHDLSSAT